MSLILTKPQDIARVENIKTFDDLIAACFMFMPTTRNKYMKECSFSYTYRSDDNFSIYVTLYNGLISAEVMSDIVTDNDGKSNAAIEIQFNQGYIENYNLLDSAADCINMVQFFVYQFVLRSENKKSKIYEENENDDEPIHCDLAKNNL